MGKKTPASVVKELFGVRALAKLLGLSPGAVSKWVKTVPSKHHERLLQLAREKRLTLTPEMLIIGV